MDDDDLPDGWVVWNDEPGGRAILAYRPDVFDSRAFPPECLPTLYVSQRSPNQGKRRTDPGPDDDWWVAFYLEPEVRVREFDDSFETRSAAVAWAVEVAGAFADGDVDYRGAYQVPREEYFAELDELTGGG
jgi:hypothetical protein